MGSKHFYCLYVFFASVCFATEQFDGLKSFDLWEQLNELNELKFCEVSRNSLSNRCWKFQLRQFQQMALCCPNFQRRFWWSDFEYFWANKLSEVASNSLLKMEWRPIRKIRGGWKIFSANSRLSFRKCHMKWAISEVGEGVTLGVICHIFAKCTHTPKWRSVVEFSYVIAKNKIKFIGCKKSSKSVTKDSWQARLPQLLPDHLCAAAAPSATFYSAKSRQDSRLVSLGPVSLTSHGHHE